jgi:hypothetical protein
VERLLLEADNVDLKLLVDRNKLRKADVEKNRILEKQGLRFDPPPGSLIHPDTVLGDVAIPPLKSTRWKEPIDPYDYVYAEVSP